MIKDFSDLMPVLYSDVLMDGGSGLQTGLFNSHPLLLVIHTVVTCEEHCLDCLGETKIVSHHVVLQNLFI